MPVRAEFVGRKFVQITHRLRWGSDHGDSVRHVVSTRPARKVRDRGGRRIYLDDPLTAPTLVEFEPDDNINVAGLLRSGAIREWTPPEKPSENACSEQVSAKAKRKKRNG